jgi:hypothetical protein
MSFIKLSKKNNIINYSITFKINNKNDKLSVLNIFLGIQDKKNNKINIIKGGKYTYNLKNNIVDNELIISNTVLYTITDNNDNFCIIVDHNQNYEIISEKSIIKIINL